VFALADEVVVDVYRATATPLTARYTDFIRGLQTLITSLQSRT